MFLPFPFARSRVSRKSGGIYLYANQQGCDGDRLYYDGCSFITLNGRVIAQGSQFSLNDVEVVTATVDLLEVRRHRSSSSRSIQASQSQPYGRLRCPERLGTASLVDVYDLEVTQPGEFKYNTPEEEIACVAASTGVRRNRLLTPSCSQIWTGVLVVGLPTALEDPGVLCPAQRWDRQLCDRDDRLLYVHPRRQGVYGRQCVSISFDVSACGC